MSHLILLAVPLFIFLGALIEMTGMARAMIQFLASLLGHVRGGLSYVLVGARYLVSGISGSKIADMAAIAPVLFPEMQKRGAKPGEPSPFKWTYHFCFGVGNFAKLYADQWTKVDTNKKVGVLLPNDADGNAIRGLLLPELEKAGFTIVDPGPYENGTADFSTQINTFRDEGCEIFNTFPFPPDFAVFWRQAAQRGLAQQVKVCQMAKAGLFAPELEALGPLGNGLNAGAYWHRAYPFSSPATGMSSRQLADGYEKARGKQWNQQVGATASLFDAALAALQACANPKDKAALAKSLSTLKAETAVGAIDFTAGPVPNCTPTGLVGVQWVKAKSGPRAFDLEIVANADHPKVPLTATMSAYQLKG